MLRAFFRVGSFLRFYFQAITIYRLHSPKVYSWATSVLKAREPILMETEIDALTRNMRRSDRIVEHVDFGTGSSGPVPLRKIVRRSASSKRQGRWLYRTVQWRKPAAVLEIGSSTGIGTAWLASAAPRARVVGLEGCPHCAAEAVANLGRLHLNNASIISGDFRDTLSGALQSLGTVDLVFFDGNHQEAPTLAYFEQCLEHAGPESIFIFDDIYWSAGMQSAWRRIREHPRVRCTVDCYELGFVFFDPAFLEKRHFRLLG